MNGLSGIGARLWRRSTLSLQLTGVLLLISILPLLVYHFVSHGVAEQTILDIASRQSLQTLRNQRDYLLLQMDQIESLAANLSQVEEITKALSRTNAPAGDTTYDRLATKARIGYLLSNYRNVRGLVSIDIVGLDGTRYHVGDTLAGSNERSELRDRLFDRTMRSEAFVTWHGVEDNIEEHSSSQKVLAASKLLLRSDSSWLRAEPLAMLLIHYSTDYLHERLSTVTMGPGAYLLVLDDQHRLVYHPDKSRIGATITPEFAALFAGSSGSFTQRLGDSDVLLSYETIPGKNWYVVSVIPKETLLAPMHGIQRVAVFMLLGMVVLILVLLRLVALRVVAPIGHIAESFRNFQLNRIEPGWRMARPRSLEPIADLAQWFNAFLESMERRQAAEEEIRQLAFYDPLTGLPNRRLLIDRLRQALRECPRRRQSLALMFLDLDKFKTLNDTLGHDSGDSLLRQVAQRLVHCVREVDTVARLGGDEFVVLLEGIGPTADEAAAQAEAVGLKVLRALSEDYEGLVDAGYHSTSSIGITVYTDAPCSLEEVMKQADIALYQAKEAGRNTLRFFEPVMQSRLMTRTALEQSVRQGLSEDQFTIYLQPKVNARRRIVGAEALVRWQHPERGLVTPQAFITLAEETGLIVPLGQAVLRKVCEQLVRWSVHPRWRELGIAVNVSPREFRQPDFVASVLRIVAVTGADPGRLTFEITESLLVDNVLDTVAKMNTLRSHGIRFAIDDFGTGYSSLAYLKRMPLQELKIDRSFVREVLTDTNDATIARAVIALGHELGIEVVAEGIESDAQQDFLGANGCRLFQGYLFNAPVSPEQFERLFDSAVAAVE
jgi:diguanylate cyclase (GGDEF)-like protein